MTGMTRQQKKRERDTNGAGSIAKLKDGRFQYWYYDPVTGKRRGKILTLPNKEGRQIPVTNKTDAEKAALSFRQRSNEITNLKDRETAQVAIAKTRKLIAGLTTTPADIWDAFEKSGTRKQDGIMTDERKAEMKRVCGLFAEWCAQNRINTLADITEDTVSTFLNAVSKGKSGRTFNAYRGVIKYIFKHTWKQLKLESNPAENIEAMAVITEGHKELTQEQVKALFDGFTTGFSYKNEKRRKIAYNPKDIEQIKVALLFAMFTGARAIDACCMKWSGINLQSNTLTFRPSKTSRTSGKVVSIPIAPPLLEGIIEAEAWKEQNRPNEDYVTPSVAVRYLENPSTICKVVQKLIECATGLKPTAEQEEGRERAAAAFGFHSLRHSFVSFAANTGIPQAVIAEIVGHGSPAITKAYSHATDEAKREAIAALPIVMAETEQIQSARQFVMKFLDECTDKEAEAVADFIRRTLPIAQKTVDVS